MPAAKKPTPKPAPKPPRKSERELFIEQLMEEHPDWPLEKAERRADALGL